MQKVGIRHGKRGKAVETLINRAPSAGLVTGRLDRLEVDGWTVGRLDPVRIHPAEVSRSPQLVCALQFLPA